MKPANCVALLLFAAVLTIPLPARAQDRPPLTEPIALEGTMTQFHRAARKVIVTTMDGVEHVYRFTKDLVVHGGKKPGVDALEGLREGTTVVIHEERQGRDGSADQTDVVADDGLQISEGIVTDINRRKEEITIRYDNGTIETLQMTNRATDEGAADPGSNRESSRVVVYYSDEEGRRIGYYFRRAS